MKIPIKKDDLLKHLVEQYKFLIKSGQQFDQGDVSEGKRIATHLRILFHQTEDSPSLFSQLEKAFNIKPKLYSKDTLDNSAKTVSYIGLSIVNTLGSEGWQYVPRTSINEPGMTEVTLDEWWSQTLILINGIRLTRSFILLKLANQDVGAHVDPAIEEKYYQLTRNNLIRWQTANKNSFKNIQLVIARESGFFTTAAINKYFGNIISL